MPEKHTYSECCTYGRDFYFVEQSTTHMWKINFDSKQVEKFSSEYQWYPGGNDRLWACKDGVFTNSILMFDVAQFNLKNGRKTILKKDLRAQNAIKIGDLFYCKGDGFNLFTWNPKDDKITKFHVKNYNDNHSYGGFDTVRWCFDFGQKDKVVYARAGWPIFEYDFKTESICFVSKEALQNTFAGCQIGPTQCVFLNHDYTSQGLDSSESTQLQVFDYETGSLKLITFPKEVHKDLIVQESSCKCIGPYWK